MEGEGIDHNTRFIELAGEIELCDAWPCRGAIGGSSETATASR